MAPRLTIQLVAVAAAILIAVTILCASPSFGRQLRNAKATVDQAHSESSETAEEAPVKRYYPGEGFPCCQGYDWKNNVIQNTYPNAVATNCNGNYFSRCSAWGNTSINADSGSFNDWCIAHNHPCAYMEIKDGVTGTYCGAIFSTWAANIRLIANYQPINWATSFQMKANKYAASARPPTGMSAAFDINSVNDSCSFGMRKRHFEYTWANIPTNWDWRLIGQGASEAKPWTWLQPTWHYVPYDQLRQPDFSTAPNVSSVSPVVDQGSCAGCYAAAAKTVLEGQYYRQNNGTSVVLSLRSLIECSSNTAVYAGAQNGHCGGGSPQWVFDYAGRATMNFNKYVGALESNNPWDPNNRPALSQNQCFSGVQVETAYIHSVYNDNNTAGAVAFSGPGVALIDASHPELALYSRGIFDIYTSGPFQFNHAVAIVGYNSTAFFVKNSWGQDWGVAGYFYPARGNVLGLTTLVQFVSSYADSVVTF